MLRGLNPRNILCWMPGILGCHIPPVPRSLHSCQHDQSKPHCPSYVKAGQCRQLVSHFFGPGNLGGSQRFMRLNPKDDPSLVTIERVFWPS